MTGPGRAARQLIITADDFGMSREVNEAVEEAHRKGVLTAASLVVTGDAAADAVERARRMPSLGVGLHLALVSADPALPPGEIPALMAPDGHGLGSSPERVGALMSLSPKVAAQARAETRAQLDLYRKTGLPLDHVDGHWHFHQHPTIVRTLVECAPEYGIRAVRVPFEPALPSWLPTRTRLARRIGIALAHRPLAAWMRRAFRQARILANDWFFGMTDGGGFNRDVLLGYLAHLPAGVTEIGLHPATRSWHSPFAPPAHWQVAAELAALTDPDVIQACRGPGRRLTTFSELVTKKDKAGC